MQPEPICTYRLQLHPGFGFNEIVALLDYFCALGISHLYTSPYLQPVTDSTHGYDIVDHSQVNSQLGGNEAHARFCQALQEKGLGLMIDVVPNHMAISGKLNPWWWDVLENGPSSHFAFYFDIDWESSEDRWPDKILLPILGDHYGRILERGELALSNQNGHITLHYQDHTFPVDPSSLAGLLNKAAERCCSKLLAFLAESYARLPKPTATFRNAAVIRHNDKAVIFKLLAELCQENPAINEAIEDQIKNLNKDPNALDALIEKQNYRLAFWRTANKDLGYRRFFDIKDLIALRMENNEVFQATHALPIEWYKRRWVHGLRIDHPDGLRNPGEYFQRLEEACPGAWIVAEKILRPGEKLPENWKAAGTTGYDFINLLAELFIDPEGEEALTNIYKNFIGESTDFNVLVRTCKALVLKELFGSELNRLTTLFVEICERHRRHRDYTRSELSEAICQTAVCFPVYRSYVSAVEKSVTSQDESFINEAITLAIKEKPDLDPELFFFLKKLLLLGYNGTLEVELALRFQQLTGAVMAKGFEDTVFYRYNRLITLNEVGVDPSIFGISVSQFHESCLNAQKQNPLSLLASTTHDTKRSEDVRARLALLSEIPEQWGMAVQHWMALNEHYRKGNVPDRNIEYLFYQTLVGAWPIDQKRLEIYMEKALREAKEFTTWTKVNKNYEREVMDFVSQVMQNEAFLADLKDFTSLLILPGRINGLAQTLLKLTAPGIPDIYQGSELWNLSLVDPDNRRPVNFTERLNVLDKINTLSIDDILKRMDQGIPKLWLIRQTLKLRKKRSDLFGPKGSYRPLYAQGKKAAHVVAFLRGEEVITLIPRLTMRLNNEWEDTFLELPKGSWHNILTDSHLNEGNVPLGELLTSFPVALLVKE